MPVFDINKTTLEPIKEKKIELEKNIQNLTENSLNEVFGLQLVSSEFTIDQFRVDTLAFDPETKSFVIIEYKRDRSSSVVDQGYSYLAKMLNNKADFILEYNEKMEGNLKRGDVDWSQSKIIFIANNFTKYQRNAIHFKDLPIELWEVKKYENDTLLYNQLKSQRAKESINTISKDDSVEQVSREVKEYTVDDHFNEGWDNSRELFEGIRERILNLDSRIEENPVKVYIGYKIDHDIVATIHTRKSKLRINLQRTKPEDLKDPEDRTSLRSNSMKYYGQYISQMDVKNEEDIDYAMMLIRQVYKEHFSN